MQNQLQVLTVRQPVLRHSDAVHATCLRLCLRLAAGSTSASRRRRGGCGCRDAATAHTSKADPDG